MKTICNILFAVGVGLSLMGCSTGPVQFQTEANAHGPEPGTDAWWAEKALLPPGVRQRCHKGKMWPVRPRPDVERQQFSHTFHSAHYWPLPYVCQDRAYVNNILDLQAQNGWEYESTLFGRYFDDEQQLTVPGQRSLENIVLINPVQYRTVFLQSSYDPTIDNVRVENVRASIARITGNPDEVPVIVKGTRDYARPAVEIDRINKAYLESTPSPRLPAGGAGGGGGGGGGLGATPSGL